MNKKRILLIAAIAGVIASAVFGFIMGKNSNSQLSESRAASCIVCERK